MTQLVYGFHDVRSRLKFAPQSLKAVYLTAKRVDKRTQELCDRLREQGVPCSTLPAADFNALLSAQNLFEVVHQGIVAEVDRQATISSLAQLWDSVDDQSASVLLVLDGVTDPHNLGACLRSAAAVGVAAVITSTHDSAPLSAVAIKAASGAADTIPYIKVPNLSRALLEIAEQGFKIFASAEDAEHSLYEVNFPPKVALIMGAEGDGIRRLTRENSHQTIFIPMSGIVESLNVSVAAAVCLFEIYRQKSVAKPSQLPTKT